MAERTGVPIEDLLFIREASGAAGARPEDRLRDAELVYVEWLALAHDARIRPAATRHLFRVQGDALRRVAESEAALWQSEVIGPATAAGQRADEILGSDLGDRMSALSEQAVVAMYHLQQTRAWTTNIIEGLETQLADAGLHSVLQHPPAMCFLDLTGYTRLTEERGDEAAAELAEELGRIVQRTSIPFGGRPVKWLGDGVMLHFPNPGRGVVAALDMVTEVEAGGLPPAHVGLHAGAVIFQEGDYYGRTVNLASRIADHAQPGQVLVSQAMVDACGDEPVAFRDVGPVALKNVAEPMRLFAASRTS